MSKRVVVVDDEADIREIATLSLETVQGWHVVTVGSGVEALAVVAREQPDAVLLDVMMPGQDGPATLAALRAQDSTRAVPVVFLTAKAQVREKAQLQELGAAGVLAKPFDPMTLGTELADLLGWQQMDDLAAALDALWLANRDKMLARGATVLAALEDAAAGRPVDLVAASREAHALAGALGTYGRPGSALFAEIERVLDGEEGATCGEAELESDFASCAERVRQALAELV